MVSEQFVQLTKHLLQGKISIAERFIKLESDNLTIISKLPEGKFCLYESIIRDDISFNFKTNRKDLIKSLELTGVVADTSTHQSCINFNGNSIKIVTQDIAFETEGENELKAQFDVELEKIGINGNQMLSLLNLIDSEDVEMAFTEINKTIYLRPSGEPHTLCLLQPVSLQ
jgi:DNA polymerase III sliding clamp (beta) subunit (PCNA family)